MLTDRFASACMRGHVYRRGGTWTYVADAGRDPATGRRRQRTKGGFASKKVAETALRQFLHARESGQLVPASATSLGEYLDQWLANLEPNARRTTYGGYRRDVGRIVGLLGGVRLHELTPMHIESAYAELLRAGSAAGGPLSAKTVYNTHSTLRRALGDAVRLGVLPRNPASAARPPCGPSARCAPGPPRSWVRSSMRSMTTRCTPPTCWSPPPACGGARSWGCGGRTSTWTAAFCGCARR
jgi:integrase